VTSPRPRSRGSLDELERRLARETELAQRQRDKTLRAAQRREAERRFDQVKRRRTLRYLALVSVLILTAVLVTLVMFRVLSLVFA
jgi:type IV secretory pathway component VirB8